MEKKNKLLQRFQELLKSEKQTTGPREQLLFDEIKQFIQSNEWNEIYEKFTKKNQEFFWGICCSVIDYYIHLIEINELATESCHSLLLLSQFIFQFLDSLSSLQKQCEIFWNLIEKLHNLLIPLNDQMLHSKELKRIISKICEKIWTKNKEEERADGQGGVEDVERFLPQLIPYLLLVALEPTSLDQDVKRVHHLKEAFLEVDYEDSTIDTIRGLLLRCFVDTKFLKVLTLTVSSFLSSLSLRWQREEDSFHLFSHCMRVSPPPPSPSPSPSPSLMIASLFS
jgi:hypothetical protein